MSTYAAGSRESAPETVPEPLQSYEIETLREIIEKYRTNQLDLSGGRPRFRKPRTNSGILLNEDIRKRALDPDYSAGKQENVCSFPQAYDMVKKIKQS